MKTDVELVEQIIRDKKSSLFLRHSSATEKDIKHLAEYLYTELIDPFLSARNTDQIQEAERQIEAVRQEIGVIDAAQMDMKVADIVKSETQKNVVRVAKKLAKRVHEKRDSDDGFKSSKTFSQYLGRDYKYRVEAIEYAVEMEWIVRTDSNELIPGASQPDAAAAIQSILKKQSEDPAHKAWINGSITSPNNHTVTYAQEEFPFQ